MLPVRTATRAPQPGEIVTLVGFGSTEPDGSGAGRRRMAQSQIREVSDELFSYSGVPVDGGNICEGDSGGPSLSAGDAGITVVGVHAGGTRGCRTLGYDTRVDSYHSWLEGASNGDLFLTDSASPQLRITAPVGPVVRPGEVTLLAEASDDWALAEVRVLVDGILAKQFSAVPPFTVTRRFSAGAYRVEWSACDLSRQCTSVAQDLQVQVEEIRVPPTAAELGPMRGGCSTAGAVLSLSALALSLGLRAKRRRVRGGA